MGGMAKDEIPQICVWKQYTDWDLCKITWSIRFKIFDPWMIIFDICIQESRHVVNHE